MVPQSAARRFSWERLARSLRAWTSASHSCFAILLMPPRMRLPPRFWVTFYLRQPFALGNGFVEAMLPSSVPVWRPGYVPNAGA